MTYLYTPLTKANLPFYLFLGNDLKLHQDLSLSPFHGVSEKTMEEKTKAPCQLYLVCDDQHYEVAILALMPSLKDRRVQLTLWCQREEFKKTMDKKGKSSKLLEDALAFLFKHFPYHKITTELPAQSFQLEAYKAAGFQVEATLRQATFFNNRWQDGHLLGLIRPKE